MQIPRIKSRGDNNLVAYGRGAKAIALASKEEGIEITVEEAQSIVNAIFAMYPGLVPMFNACKMRAASRNSRQPARWLQGSFGRYRRFPVATDDKVKGDFERQAQNFPN